MPASLITLHGGHMSRQQNRAIERKRSKTAFQNFVSPPEKAQPSGGFWFRPGKHAFAAEPEKGETFILPPGVVQDQTNPYVPPQSSLSRFPEPLKDTPKSVTVVPQKLIEEQAGSTFRDALRNVRGIGVTAGEGGGAQGDSFTLRGYNARNDMYIDGGRDQGTYFRDSFNLEAVDVLKGPSSTYFGRGSTGGAINQVSKTPRLDPTHGEILISGSDFYLRGSHYRRLYSPAHRAAFAQTTKPTLRSV
jgi:outer membrane receptor for monomeric catechols